MINTDSLSTPSGNALSAQSRRRLVYLSPVAIILLGQLITRIGGPRLGVWGWLPLNVGYWTATAMLIAWGGGKPAINRWLQPSRGNRWPSLVALIVVVPALPMLFPETWRLFFQVQVWLPTIFFVLINPCLEEGYWRGLLLDATSGWNKWLAISYSSVLFMLNHLWIAVLVTGARNPVASAYQFVFGVFMSLIYLKTQSLRWPVATHFLVNLFTPTVAVFLNLYVPGAPG